MPVTAVERALRTECRNWRSLRLTLTAAAIAASCVAAPRSASAQNLLDFLFGGAQQQRPQPQPQPQRGVPPAVANFFADPFGLNTPSPPPQPTRMSGGGPAFCVRSCDGKYFQLSRGGATPAQMCQAFCPASPTKVFFGSSITGAVGSNGERYADSENAFAYRKALKADCTCNGRDPAGLAPVDLSLDASLRPGDVIATASGLVAYSGVRVGVNQTAEFTPVSSYPGLTAEVRNRLGEMKVAPVSADMLVDHPPSDSIEVAPLPAPIVMAPKPKRAEAR